MIRGLVSPTYAASDVADAVAPSRLRLLDERQADWPTRSRRSSGGSGAVWCERSRVYRPRVSRLDVSRVRSARRLGATRRRDPREHHPLDWTELDDEGGRHRPGPGHGRRPEGRQRPPRHGDEPGAGGVPAVPEGDAPQPGRPALAGRDRFVLSCGHSSLTLYIQLYLGGYGLELDDLKALRTWGSKTPGHPEYGHTAGVETTTGPLGQGVGNAVGMAMAARRERGLLDPDAAAGKQPVRPRRLRDRAATATSRRASAARPRRIAGHQQLGNLVAASTTTTRSRSRTTPTSRSARTSRSATRPTAGTCRPSTGPTTASDVRRGRPGAVRRRSRRPRR